MLKLSSAFINQPILSLRVGHPVAYTTRPIINPNNLKIEGFYCKDTLERNKTLILLCQDIREMVAQGLVIDDHDVLVEPEDLIRLKEILAINFALIDKKVISDTKQKIGKVSDYAVDLDSMFIKKLYVEQSMLKSIIGGSLTVDRTQVVAVSDRTVTILDPLQHVSSRAPEPNLA